MATEDSSREPQPNDAARGPSVEAQQADQQQLIPQQPQPQTQPQPIAATETTSNSQSGSGIEPSQPPSAPPPQQQQQQEPSQPSSSSQQQQEQEQQQPHPEESSQPSNPPASPPLPARHTATTPGPRAQRFQESFDAALARTLAKISTDNFGSCYPTIAAHAPHILRQVQRSMVDRLAQLCAAEFGKILERYTVVPRLNELESLVSDAELRRRSSVSATATGQRRTASSIKGKGKDGGSGSGNGNGRGNEEAEGTAKPLPPHLLPAETILAAHLAPHLASQQSQMNARLQNTQAANAVLWEEIQAQRNEVEQLLASLEASLADIHAAAGLMDDLPAEQLAAESQAVEMEIVDL